jgi:Rrf2 family protein
MRISAKADYAVRAAAELAAGEARGVLRLITSDEIAAAQGISRGFLLDILASLRRAGLVTTRRGTEGGARLARPAAQISVADVLRAIDGPLEVIQDLRPEELVYTGAATELPVVWVAARASLRRVLENVTLAHLAAGEFPPAVRDLAADPDAWAPH